MNLVIKAVFPENNSGWFDPENAVWQTKEYILHATSVACVRPRKWGKKEGVEIILTNGSWHFTEEQIIFKH